MARTPNTAADPATPPNIEAPPPPVFWIVYDENGAGLTGPTPEEALAATADHVGVDVGHWSIQEMKPAKISEREYTLAQRGKAITDIVIDIDGKGQEIATLTFKGDPAT